MRRANTMERKRFMGPINAPREIGRLSDPSDLAKFMLKAGYRTAKKCVSDNYRAAQRRSDKESAEMWHVIGIWINLLSD